MRFALCLKGLHSIQTYAQHGFTDTIKQNSLESFDNINEMIINIIKESGHEVDTFISTYDCDLGDYLIDLYKPKKYYKFDKEIMKYNRINTGVMLFESIANHIIKLQELISEYNYDYIIITRFDLLFTRPYNSFPIDYDKFNINCRHISGNSDDNLWIFKNKYSKELKDSLIEQIKSNDPALKTTHYVNRTLESYNVPINYFYDMKTHNGQMYVYFKFNNRYTNNN
jgi:hypothetical protein